MQGKVEIAGVNTAKLKVLKNEETMALLRRTKEGDQEARRQLIEGNLRLVLSVIQRFSSRGENVDDLFQVGCVGLIKAIDNFDINQPVKFSTYGVPMIIGEIRRYLRDNSAMRVSRAMRDTAYRVLQAKEAYMAQHQKEPTVEETVSIMEAGGYDLCAWGMNIVQEGAEDIYFGRWKRELFQFPSEAEKRRFLCRWVLPCRVGWSVYCRVFRRDIIRRFHLRFDTGLTLFEDLDFFVRYLSHCRNLYYVPKPLYAYRQHGASAMHTNDLEKQLNGVLHMVRSQDRALSSQPLFRPFYLYGGTVLSVLLWNFTQTGPEERGLVQAVRCLEASVDWDYLLEQARLAAQDRAGIRKACGWRLGGQVNGLYHYILTRDSRAYCRANRFQRWFISLRTWKNKLMHG